MNRFKNLKMEGGKVEMPLETFFGLVTFLNELVQDNTDMNQKLNKLSDIICNGMEKSLEDNYCFLQLDGFEVASVIQDRYEFEKQYEELRKVRNNERISKTSEDSSTVICA